MPVKVSEISVAKLRGYREFAFAAVLAQYSHVPFFSFERPEDWVSIPGYELYETWLKNSEDLSLHSDKGFKIEKASTNDIRKFRDIITTSLYVQHPYFSIDNAQEWIRPVAFEAWMMWFKQATSMSARSSSRMSSVSLSSPSRAPSRLSETSDIVDDNGSVNQLSSKASIPPSRRSSSAGSSFSNTSGYAHNPISISDDEDIQITSTSRGRSHQTKPLENYRYRDVKLEPKEEDVPVLVTNKRSRPVSPEEIETSTSSKTAVKASLPRAATSQNKKARSSPAVTGPIKITTKLHVDRLETRTTVPDTWAVPRDKAVTLLDLTDLEALPTKKDGGTYSLDAFIRAEDQDSWGGSTGHTSGDVRVWGFHEDPKRFERCRRTHLNCKGVDVCQFFDQDLLKDHERYEPDPQEMRNLWSHELDANEREASSGTSVIARFYNRVMRLKCSVPCNGKAVMRLRAQGRSKYGKDYFIGCSAWRPSEKDSHRYLGIPYNVDEDTLQHVMDNQGAFPTDSAPNDKCVLAVHPRVGQKTCPYSHIIDGVITGGRMVPRKCNTELVIFVPLDPSIKKAIVLVRNAHNHPMHPKSKPSIKDRQKLNQAIEAAGVSGLTVQKLLNAPSTLAIYGGKSLVIDSPAFMDRRRLRDAVNEKQAEINPHGNGWKGLFHQFFNREKALPASDRYIQSVTGSGDTKWIFTMHPRLAKYIHHVLFLCVDYTFKRVKGDINEWEVVGFLERFKRRITFARFYCDRNTRTAFSRLWAELFRLVPELTGSPLKFFAFFPDDPTAMLRAIILDAEAPQAQGLEDELQVYLARYAPDFFRTFSGSALDVLLMILKTCCIHFERNIDKLPSTISHNVKARLKGFIGLKTQDEINEWHAFVEAIPDKSVQDWYSHKTNYPWLLPSLNQLLSKMDKSSWELTPLHTNLVEGGHSGTNLVTSINKEIAQSIESARVVDTQMADEIEAMLENGTMPKRWNGPMEREHRSDKRQAWSHSKRQKLDNDILQFSDLQKQLDTLSSQKDASLALSKGLEEDVKSITSKDPDSKQRKKELQGQIKLEKQKRSRLTELISEIRSAIQELKDNGLKGRRISSHLPNASTTDANKSNDTTPLGPDDADEITQANDDVEPDAMDIANGPDRPFGPVLAPENNGSDNIPSLDLDIAGNITHVVCDLDAEAMDIASALSIPDPAAPIFDPLDPLSAWPAGALEFIETFDFEMNDVFMSPEYEAAFQQALNNLRTGELSGTSTTGI